ncbi:uncharacterized protein BT62DRAFT_1000732 [Guyanagaster necrorhizus]|uniref:Uncharacterized protein n=1 Tax=Guyanagaster necrorhizus TaxID=856835 RepID=A0A9P7W2P4_9AGAR|nr:uncharacterized protein BT62DRAFT_1000732 [Guyanagaster necrorhizus MCA 3950]KAG7451479.1 hypothetical protein BT62DRAFT_1000732 [Guyanagaster necrorhizus MCA 3950]
MLGLGAQQRRTLSQQLESPESGAACFDTSETGDHRLRVTLNKAPMQQNDGNVLRHSRLRSVADGAAEKSIVGEFPKDIRSLVKIRGTGAVHESILRFGTYGRKAGLRRFSNLYAPFRLSTSQHDVSQRPICLRLYSFHDVDLSPPGVIGKMFEFAAFVEFAASDLFSNIALGGLFISGRESSFLLGSLSTTLCHSLAFSLKLKLPDRICTKNLSTPPPEARQTLSFYSRSAVLTATCTTYYHISFRCPRANFALRSTTTLGAVTTCLPCVQRHLLFGLSRWEASKLLIRSREEISSWQLNALRGPGIILSAHVTAGRIGRDGAIDARGCPLDEITVSRSKRKSRPPFLSLHNTAKSNDPSHDGHIGSGSTVHCKTSGRVKGNPSARLAPQLANVSVTHISPTGCYHACFYSLLRKDQSSTLTAFEGTAPGRITNDNKIRFRAWPVLIFFPFLFLPCPLFAFLATQVGSGMLVNLTALGCHCSVPDPFLKPPSIHLLWSLALMLFSSWVADSPAHGCEWPLWGTSDTVMFVAPSLLVITAISTFLTDVSDVCSVAFVGATSLFASRRKVVIDGTAVPAWRHRLKRARLYPTFRRHNPCKILYVNDADRPVSFLQGANSRPSYRFWSHCKHARYSLSFCGA